MSDKIKFAVVGLGNIGKRHVEVVLQNDECELVAVVDRLHNSHNINHIPLFSSLEELFLSGIDVDVITIATPNGIHAEQALKALDQRKHVLVEKPLALIPADARRLIEKSAEVHKHVFTVMQNRYSLPSIWLKDLVRTGVLGKIFIVQVNCFWNRDRRYYLNNDWRGTKDLDGGTLFTQFSHFVDMIYWVFGGIKNINSKFANFNHEGLIDFEDSGFVNFDFENGGTGCINYSTSLWDKNMESSIIVIGESGSVKIAGQYMDAVEYCHIKDYTMPDFQNTKEYNTYKGNHQFVISNVVDVLKGRGEMTSNAIEGLVVVKIISDIYSTRTDQN